MGGDRKLGGLTGGRFDVAGYLDYQGQRFISDSTPTPTGHSAHHERGSPLRGYASAQEAYGRIEARLSFSASAPTGFSPPERCANLRNRFALPVPRRIPRDGKRPWPRRVPGRAGGVGAAVAVGFFGNRCARRRGQTAGAANRLLPACDPAFAIVHALLVSGDLAFYNPPTQHW